MISTMANYINNNPNLQEIIGYFSNEREKVSVNDSKGKSTQLLCLQLVKVTIER